VCDAEEETFLVCHLQALPQRLRVSRYGHGSLPHNTARCYRSTLAPATVVCSIHRIA
jgi:hypothetical protein